MSQRGRRRGTLRWSEDKKKNDIVYVIVQLLYSISVTTTELLVPPYSCNVCKAKKEQKYSLNLLKEKDDFSKKKCVSIYNSVKKSFCLCIISHFITNRYRRLQYIADQDKLLNNTVIFL